MATLTTDLQITATAGAIGFQSGSATLTTDLQITASGALGTNVAGSQLPENKRIVAIGNNQLWYEDI